MPGNDKLMTNLQIHRQKIILIFKKKYYLNLNFLEAFKIVNTSVTLTWISDMLGITEVLLLIRLLKKVTILGFKLNKMISWVRREDISQKEFQLPEIGKEWLVPDVKDIPTQTGHINLEERKLEGQELAHSNNIYL